MGARTYCQNCIIQSFVICVRGSPLERANFFPSSGEPPIEIFPFHRKYYTIYGLNPIKGRKPPRSYKYDNSGEGSGVSCLY